MKYTFQHFVDLKTSAESMQVIQIDAGGDYLMQRTRHLWPAFKYMKLGSISIKLLPASTLPVDPMGLSYEDEEYPTIDPRDQMNPGLVRITNGEDIDTRIPSNAGVQMDIYNNMMLDPRWSKFMLQSGFKRTAKPLYWQIGQLHQDAYPGATLNYPTTQVGVVYGTSTHIGAGSTSDPDGVNGPAPYGTFDADHSDPRGFFQTGHRGRMGWLPTDALIKAANRASSSVTVETGTVLTPYPNVMPCINCITVVLPKMYRTNYYYRMFITETVYFAGVKNVGLNDTDNMEHTGLDVFVRAGVPLAYVPEGGPDNRYLMKFGVGQTTPNREYSTLNDGSDE